MNHTTRTLTTLTALTLAGIALAPSAAATPNCTGWAARQHRSPQERTTMSVEICGYSDDLIEIYGDLREEHDAIDAIGRSVPCIITLFAADGRTVSLNIMYAPEGVWRIGVHSNPDGAEVSIDKAPDDSEDCYSDNAVVAGTWTSAVVKPFS